MKLRIVQVKSRISEVPKAKRTLDALGLRRNYRSVVHEDTPQLRGMLRSIAHLVRYEEWTGGEATKPKSTKTASTKTPKHAPVDPEAVSDSAADEVVEGSDEAQ